MSNKKVNCWDTLTGNAEGNQQPSSVARETRYAEGSSTIPLREYPSSHGAYAPKARGSAPTQEWVDDIVSALWKHKEWSPIDTEKPAEWLATFSEQIHGLKVILDNLI